MDGRHLNSLADEDIVEFEPEQIKQEEPTRGFALR